MEGEAIKELGLITVKNLWKKTYRNLSLKKHKDNTGKHSLT